MNTERPDNDDATGSAEERGAEASGVEEADAAGQTDAAGEADAQEAVAEESGAAQEAPGSEAGEPDTIAPGAGEAGADEGEDGVPDATPDAEARHAEEGARPPRRRSPVAVVSVAAAVLLVGGGGAYLAASGAGGSGGGATSGASGHGTPPPLALDGYSEGGTGGIAPGEPNPYGVTYRPVGALPDGPGSAPVYRAKGEVTKDEVARLAKALGVDGTPVAEGQAWQVGPVKDGSGPSLQVNRQAPGAWSFHRYAPGTDACKSTVVCTQDPANPAGDTVSEDAAKKAAAPVLKAVGQDDAKLDASQVMGDQRVVNAEPSVGGLPTYGWTTGLTVSAQGDVVGGTGQLKAPVKGDTYPVLDARKTLALMNAAPATDHRMGIGGCATPVPLKDRLEEPCGQSTSTPTPQRETITVEKAVFGLAAHVVDGRQALVPSWLFQVRASGAQDGFTVTHPAVDPKYLASTTPSGEPTGQASPQPTRPGDEPTSAPKTRDVKVERYTAEGTDLTVAFTGGVCADYKATASESSDKVTVTVTETPWPGKVCIMIAKEYHKTLKLDEPLGDRKVVGTDSKAIPLEKTGARLPGPYVAQ